MTLCLQQCEPKKTTIFEPLKGFGLVWIKETKLRVNTDFTFIQFRLDEFKNSTTVKDKISSLTQHQTPLL